MARGSHTVVLVAAVVAVAAGSVHAGGTAAPTIRKCAQLERKAPPLRGSLLAATVFCLRPIAIRTNATVTWTTCPTTPRGEGESCAEGEFAVKFRTRAGIVLNRDIDAWGGENVPGAGLWSLPGTGTYSCTSAYVDRDRGTPSQTYKKSIAVRDQGIGFAAVGSRIRIGWSVHPGRRGPMGYNAEVKLGQPGACVVGLPIGVNFLRTIWPSKTVSTAALQGSRMTVTSTGASSFIHPYDPSVYGFQPGVKVEAKARWTNSVTIIAPGP